MYKYLFDCSLVIVSRNRNSFLHSLNVLFHFLLLGIFLIWYQSRSIGLNFLLFMATPHFVVARPEDLPSSPFYIHPKENPSLILVYPPLSASNYLSWSRSMRIALLSKNKLQFIDENTPALPRTDPIYHVWERCNNLVLF